MESILICDKLEPRQGRVTTIVDRTLLINHRYVKESERIKRLSLRAKNIGQGDLSQRLAKYVSMLNEENPIVEVSVVFPSVSAILHSALSAIADFIDPHRRTLVAPSIRPNTECFEVTCSAVPPDVLVMVGKEVFKDHSIFLEKQNKAKFFVIKNSSPNRYQSKILVSKTVNLDCIYLAAQVQIGPVKISISRHGKPITWLEATLPAMNEPNEIHKWMQDLENKYPIGLCKRLDGSFCPLSHLVSQKIDGIPQSELIDLILNLPLIEHGGLNEFNSPWFSISESLEFKKTNLKSKCIFLVGAMERAAIGCVQLKNRNVEYVVLTDDGRIIIPSEGTIQQVTDSDIACIYSMANAENIFVNEFSLGTMEFIAECKLESGKVKILNVGPVSNLLPVVNLQNNILPPDVLLDMQRELEACLMARILSAYEHCRILPGPTTLMVLEWKHSVSKLEEFDFVEILNDISLLFFHEFTVQCHLQDIYGLYYIVQTVFYYK
jgi:hypothetical protein